MVNLTHLAGKAVGAARAAGARLTGYRGIFRTLKRDHGELSVLVVRDQAEHDSGARARLFPELRAEILAHGRAELGELYPHLADHPATAGMVRRGHERHQHIEALLDQLDSLPFGDPGWLDRLQILVLAVQAHVRGEEHHLYPVARELLTSHQIESLDLRYRAERDRLRRAELDRAMPPPPPLTMPPTPSA